MTKLIIMVAAFAPQAGKSTFAKELGTPWVFNFAEPMKRMLQGLLEAQCGYKFSEAVEALWGNTKGEPFRLSPDPSVTHRKMMQTLGTEWRLALGYENLWADILKDKIARKDFSTCIIDDWRFLNEYQVIKDLEKDGFKVITVCIRNTNAEANYNGTHASEGELKDFGFDFTFNNNGSLDEFKAEVKEFAKSLESRL